MIPGESNRPTDSAGRGDSAGRSIGELFRGLVDDAKAIVHDEVELAKTETKENVTALAKDLVPFGVAAVIGSAAFLLMVIAIDTAFTVLLAHALSLSTAVWLAPLVLAIAGGLIARSLVSKAKQAIKRRRLGLDKTKATLQEDKQWIKQHLS